MPRNVNHDTILFPIDTYCLIDAHPFYEGETMHKKYISGVNEGFKIQTIL